MYVQFTSCVYGGIDESSRWCISGVRGGSRTAVTSKVELFVMIVNDWMPLTIITKSSTLHAAAVLDLPLGVTVAQDNSVLDLFFIS